MTVSLLVYLLQAVSEPDTSFLGHANGFTTSGAGIGARSSTRGIPSDIASLERNYLLADEDLELIGTRRRPENRLGLALHISLLRHPGQGSLDDTEPPVPLVAWLV